MNFIGFGAMDVTKPYKFIGFGAMDVTCRASGWDFRPGLAPGSGKSRPNALQVGRVSSIVIWDAA